MKKLTQKILDSYGPCYPASRYYDDTYEGDILQLANDARIPFQDRLWVIMRKDLVSEKFMRLFAVWCARQVVSKKLGSDPRSINALNVAVAFAFGEATEAKLLGAWNAAHDVTQDTPHDATRSALESAAWCAAGSASESAVRSAECSVYLSDANSSCANLWSAARIAGRDAQEKQLIAMIEAGIHTGDVK